MDPATQGQHARTAVRVRVTPTVCRNLGPGPHLRNTLACTHARSDLIAGGAGYDQSGYPTSGGGASSASSARRGPRVFGQETDKTRGVDNQGVLQVGPCAPPVLFLSIGSSTV